MCLCVKEVRQCNGFMVIHTSLGSQSGNREIPDIYLLFCGSHISLNPEVLPPERTPTMTIPLSDGLSEMRKKKLGGSIQGPHQKIVTAPKFWTTSENSHSTKIMLPPNTIYRNMSLAEVKKKSGS